MSELRHCSHHPKCQGPSLIADHATLCPYQSGAECDNDECWLACPYCVYENNGMTPLFSTAAEREEYERTKTKAIDADGLIERLGREVDFLIGAVGGTKTRLLLVEAADELTRPRADLAEANDQCERLTIHSMREGMITLQEIDKRDATIAQRDATIAELVGALSDVWVKDREGIFFCTCGGEGNFRSEVMHSPDCILTRARQGETK